MLARIPSFAAAALLSLSLTGASPDRPAAQAPEPQVHIESGNIAGIAADGVAAYEGIPYAAPPVGDRRWRAPAPPVPWSGVRHADGFGPACIQPAGGTPFVSLVGRATTRSEDCLTLNVWAPTSGAGRLPVMVWLHGGSNRAGTAAITFYDGTAFAHDGIVLVSANYRLGAFGFFAHRALGPDANFGLLDQIAALRWVRANIAAFGGDPANVTLFGESAGGEDTLALATTHAADGLFRRIIVESGSDIWAKWPTRIEAAANGARLASALGLPGDDATAEQLRALPADKVEGASGDDSTGPIVDGRLFTAPPSETVARGVRVPIVIGTNGGDGSILGGFTDARVLFPALSAAAFATISERYAEDGITDPGELAKTFFRDGFFAAPARWVAARTTAAGVPAYLYRFDYIASVLGTFRTAATHGSEIPFVFETFRDDRLSAADKDMEIAIHGCWVAFAKTGVPRCPGAEAWAPYDARNRLIMNFDAHPAPRDLGNDAILDLFQRDLLR